MGRSSSGQPSAGQVPRQHPRQSSRNTREPCIPAQKAPASPSVASRLRASLRGITLTNLRATVECRAVNLHVQRLIVEVDAVSVPIAPLKSLTQRLKVVFRAVKVEVRAVNIEVEQEKEEVRQQNLENIRGRDRWE